MQGLFLPALVSSLMTMSMSLLVSWCQSCNGTKQFLIIQLCLEHWVETQLWNFVILLSLSPCVNISLSLYQWSDWDMGSLLHLCPERELNSVFSFCLNPNHTQGIIGLLLLLLVQKKYYFSKGVRQGSFVTSPLRRGAIEVSSVPSLSCGRQQPPLCHLQALSWLHCLHHGCVVSIIMSSYKCLQRASACTGIPFLLWM